MKTYRIVSDAVVVEVQANTESEAVAKFAQKESSYKGCQTVEDLKESAESAGGWIKVMEV